MIEILFLIFLLGFSEGLEPRYDYLDPGEIPELQYLDKSVDPCDNFYKYSCGNFKNVKPKPEDKHIWDHFTILQEEIYSVLKVILEAERKPNEPIALQKAKAYYIACNNVEYTDKLRLSEAAVLRSIGGWPLVGTEVNSDFSWEYIGNLIAEYGLGLFFDIQVGPNLFNATENAVWIWPDQVKNPQIYGKLDENLDLLEKASQGGQRVIPFVTFMTTISKRLRDELGSSVSEDDMVRDINEVLDLMRLMKQYRDSPPEPEVPLPPLATSATVEQLQKWTDDVFGLDSEMNWVRFLNAVFRLSGVKITSKTRLNVSQPKWIYWMIKMVSETEQRIIQNFVMVRLFTYMAPDSDKVMRDAFNRFYTEQNYEVLPRWQYCLKKTIGSQRNIDFSIALTYEYQRYHFNVNKLESAKEMILDLYEAFDEILDDSDWMDDQSRARAKKKALNMITLLAYPEEADDAELLDKYYENLRICTWDHFGNSQRLRAFRQALQFSQINSTRAREKWTNSPLEVNAFYNRPNNRIVFPVSILDPVFFTGHIRALDYGRIGTIIGHEITHGYDSSGKNYDENGSFTNWWTPNTLEGFKERSSCFVDQYSQYLIEEIDTYVNATRTLDENIADNGGIREAFKAFKKLKSRRSSMLTVEGYTPEQLFFIGYSTMWCMQESNHYLISMAEKDAYPPGRFRVIGSLTNLEEFAETFNCPVGSNMNPGNSQRCRLW